MNRTQVSSSNIKSVGYDEPNQILEIEFKQGAVYQYKPVNVVIFNSLMTASSIGSYFAKEIKHSFDVEKIN